MAGSDVGGKVAVLDPYTCIPKRSRKYASECTEVYLAKQGAEKISEDFSHFKNLEVIWFNANRLSRIENLEANFRIQEVYIEDNRLVSLSGLKPFKFLRVLLAGNNQLRNLDKQLAVLSRFAFLRKLELFGNPVAEEPDYRLRVIYHEPQVELLDQSAVTGPERIKADEVVPNLDKVSANRPKPKKPAPEHSLIERACFREAKEIRERMKREEDALLNKQSFTRAVEVSSALLPKRFLAEFRLDPAKNFLKDLAKPSQLEKYEMRPLIEKRAGKPELNREEVNALCEDLARDGVDEVGRVLAGGDALKRLGLGVEAATSQKAVGASPSNPSHILDRLLESPDAAVPTSEVATWLLTLEWPHPDGQENDRRIKQAFEDAKRAERAGDAENLATCRSTILRLTRGHSYVGHPTSGSLSDSGGGPGGSLGRKASRHSVSLLATTAASATKTGARGDVFKQTFLRPCHSVDAAGRAIMSVNHEGRHTVIGDRTGGAILPALK